MKDVLLIVTQTLPYLLMLVGGYLFWTGLSAWIRGSRQFGESGGRLPGMVRGFRVGIIGLAVVGIGLWLLTGEIWILVLSLAVGGEELLETSFIIWAIRSDPRLQATEPDRPELRPTVRIDSSTLGPSHRVGHHRAD